MTKKILFFASLMCSTFIAQAQGDLTSILSDGRLTLSKKGASYFANLSLNCTNKAYPHDYREHLQKAEDLKSPDKLWPSFYGCFDWHSSVHNHWALVKLLKTYPYIPEAKKIKEKLDKSFDAKNILAEVKYFKSHDEDFEFPYGQSWLLKVHDELLKWNDDKAKKWAKNLEPLTYYIVSSYLKKWPTIEEANYSGSHYASSLGLSFAYDYAVSAKNDSLKTVVSDAAKAYYTEIKKFPLQKEPFGYDFMSAGLLIADMMRKIMPQEEYQTWLKAFAPELFSISGVAKVLKVQKLSDHSGYASHWDGFHLNRIWCLNGILKSVSSDFVATEIKNTWIEQQKEMWDYAQESIGKGNYDIDHWLSSFSVFALIGYND